MLQGNNSTVSVLNWSGIWASHLRLVVTWDSMTGPYSDWTPIVTYGDSETTNFIGTTSGGPDDPFTESTDEIIDYFYRFFPEQQATFRIQKNAFRIPQLDRCPWGSDCVASAKTNIYCGEIQHKIKNTTFTVMTQAEVDALTQHPGLWGIPIYGDLWYVADSEQEIHSETANIQIGLYALIPQSDGEIKPRIISANNLGTTMTPYTWKITDATDFVKKYLDWKHRCIAFGWIFLPSLGLDIPIDDAWDDEDTLIGILDATQDWSQLTLWTQTEAGIVYRALEGPYRHESFSWTNGGVADFYVAFNNGVSLGEFHAHHGFPPANRK